MVRIEVRSSQEGIDSVWIEVKHVTEAQLREIHSVFDAHIKSGKQVSTAVSEVFQFTVRLCPEANPSDLWHHIIYRRLLELRWNDQQWKRIAGFALERALEAIYKPLLEPHDIRMRIVKGSEATQILSDIGLLGAVKISKIDLFIEGLARRRWIVFGAAHVKSSIAERIQDDVPASLAFIRKGLLSVALTMDAKSFPPPHGDGINYGELGGRSFLVDKGRLKRDYIEIDGQFDALFSFFL